MQAFHMEMFDWNKQKKQDNSKVIYHLDYLDGRGTFNFLS